MINQLPSIHPSLGQATATSVHLHGSASLPQFDGYASDVTRRGWFKDYEYPNFQPARTLWYHDHGVHHTAENAYAGLYAQYHMHDRAERELLPQGEFDVPVTVADALFDANGALTIGENQSGLWGDVILVNGRPWPVMKVKRRIYRFRFLVASISRSYRFQLGNGDPVTVVGTDGGLMPKARQVSQWRQGSAERYEVLIDFRRYRAGQRVVLRNLSNDEQRGLRQHRPGDGVRRHGRTLLQAQQHLEPHARHPGRQPRDATQGSRRDPDPKDCACNVRAGSGRSTAKPGKT